MSKGKCKHFTGTMNDACDVGVKYADVRIANAPGKGYSLPCMEKYNAAGATCDKCAMPTAEEVEAERIEHEKDMADTMKARAAIVAHLGGPWKKGNGGATGRIDCPVCGVVKGLAFSRSGYNGHIHATCQTPDCVNWME